MFRRASGIGFGLVLLLISMAFSVASAQGERTIVLQTSQLLLDDQHATVWWVSSAEKVPLQGVLSKEKTARWNDALADDRVTVSLAQNEYEAFQLVIRPHRDWQDFRLSVFFDGFDSVPAPTIEYYRVGYMEVERPSGPFGTSGMHADMLIPDESWDLNSEHNNVVWVKVYVPSDVTAGAYDGVITLWQGQQSVQEIALSMTVHPFALPENPSLETAGLLWGDRIDRFDPEARKNDYVDYYQNLKEHRLTGAPILHSIEVVPVFGKSPLLRTEAHDRIASYLLDELGFTFTLFTGLGYIDHHGTHRFPDGVTWRSFRIFENDQSAELSLAFKVTFEDYLKTIADHLRDKGWLDKSYVYIVDELDPRDQLTVERQVSLFRFMKQVDPEVRILLTSPPIRELWPYVDLWIVHADHFDEFAVAINEAINADQNVWIYHNSIALIDYPAIRSRLLPWIMWKIGIKGSLSWWSLTYWTDNPWEPTKPWAGDGVLMYPPFPGSQSSGPMDSIRWEVFRDGLEDYEYLVMLISRIEEAKNRLSAASDDEASLLDAAIGAGEEVLRKADELIKGIPRVSPPYNAPYDSDVNTYLEVREEIAQSISRLVRLL